MRSIFVVFLLVVLISSTIASALTASIGNARMVLRAEVGQTLEKSVLVKNVNDVAVKISMFVSGDLQNYTKLDEKEFNLNPGDEKNAYFTIKAINPGTYETNINVQYTPETGNGVGLSSTVVLIAYGEGQMPDDTNNDVVDNPDNGNSTGDAANDSGSSGKFNSKIIIFLISTLFLFIAFGFLIFLMIKSKKRAKKR